LFEEVVRGGPESHRAIAEFLDLPVEGFASSPGKVNASTTPRFPALSGMAVKTGRRLRRRHLEPVVDLAGRLGLRRALANGRPLPPLDPGSRSTLSRAFEEEFDELELCMQIDLGPWKK
jgi:hypothetical protein